MDDLERQVASATSKRQRWAKVAVVPQASEGADTEAEAMAKWRKVYALFDATGEAQFDEVFAAVNYYFLKNGCSPAGKYAKPIRTAGGDTVVAAEVTKITGTAEGDIRQFLRGRLEDSYTFLKHNNEVREDGELRQRMARLGLPQDKCWLCADWLGKDCKYFVGDESEIYNRMRSANIALSLKKRAVAPRADDAGLSEAPESKVSTQEVVRGGGQRPLFDY